VREGFRSGGYSTRATSDLTFAPFNPETVREYEIGFKNNSDLGGAALTNSLAVFYQDYQDVQKQVPDTSTATIVTVIANTAKQVNSGAELETSIDFQNGLTASLFYAYLDAEIKEGRLPGEFELRGSPRHQVGATLNYSADLAAAGALNVNLSAVYRGEMHLDEYDVEGDEPEHTVVNFRASLNGIAGTGLGAALFVNNLTDEKYRVGVLGLMREVGFLTDVYGEPRTFGAEVSYKF
jgi:iron complex outermembrane receptor protein